MTRIRVVLSLSFVSAALGASALGACSTDAPTTAPDARLVPMSDCGAVKDYMKQVEIAKMNRAIDDELASYIRGERCYYGYGGEDTAGSPSPGTGSGSGGGHSDTGPTTGTGTNNQVAGV